MVILNHFYSVLRPVDSAPSLYIPEHAEVPQSFRLAWIRILRSRITAKELFIVMEPLRRSLPLSLWSALDASKPPIHIALFFY